MAIFQKTIQGLINGVTYYARVYPINTKGAAQSELGGQLVSVVPTEGRLPYGYTEVEYIESTGKQYIDTSVTVNSNNVSTLRIIADIELVKTANLYSVNGSGSTHPIVYFGVSNGGVIAYGVGTSDKTSTTTYRQGRYTWDYNIVGKYLEVIGHGFKNSFSFTKPTSGSKNLYISAYNGDGVANCHSEKIYSYQYYINGELVRDFVPCVSAVEGAGLFDLVNKTFYKNAGSSSFNAGPEV